MAHTIKTLVGSGDRIALVLLPFLAVGLVANLLAPAAFTVGGPAPALAVAAIVVLVPGVVLWLWSAALIVIRVPRGELITSGPFALVRHPLYTSVALLVLPALGVLLDSWLGALLGVVLYLASRRHAPAEERTLARTFGRAWDDYRAHVLLPWL